MLHTYTSMKQTTFNPSFIHNGKDFRLQMSSKEIKTNDSSVNNYV